MGELAVIDKSELSKVKDNSLNEQQLNFLFKETPKTHIYERPAKGGGKWKYVTGTYIKKVLNLMFGWNWDFEVVKYEYDLNIKQVYVLGKLTCRSNGREIIKMQFGRKDIIFKRNSDLPLDLGNDLKAATTDALKKCASEFGIASDVFAPNEFKAIKVTSSTERIEELKAKISDLLKDNQDTEDVMKIEKDILEHELNNEATEEFYEEIIANLLVAKL